MFFGGGGWDRTTDLQIMSLTSYHCSTPRHVPTLYQYIDEVNLLNMVPMGGVEPPTTGL